MQNVAITHLPSQNEAHGFFGTIRHHAEPDEAWPLAMGMVARTTSCPDEAVRAFLDSRYGRHFADEVADALARVRDLAPALEQAIERWMDRRIDRRTEDELGIPAGLPYLTGLVRMQEALLEFADRRW